MKPWKLWMAGLVLFLISCNDRFQNNDKIKVVSWGGKFQESLMNDWLTIAAKKAGVGISEGTWNGDYAALTSKILKDLNAWDLVHVENYYINVDSKAELFEKIPKDIFSNINPDYANDYAVPLLEYGYILTAQEELIPPDAKINDSIGWKDFWDVKKFPGKRCLRDFPIGNLEIALIAEGKDVKTYLYDSTITRGELDARVTKAIAKFKDLKDNLIWYTSGDELQTSMERKETVFTAAWSGRVASAFKTLCKNTTIEKCTLKTFPNTALISVDWWVVPKNSSNKENTFKLLRAAFTTAVLDSARNFALSQGYSLPLNDLIINDPLASFFLDAGSMRNKQKIAKLDEKFWSKNFTWINKRWEEFRF